MSTRRIISGTVYYGVIPKLTILINVLILPIITPYLTTDDYGIQGVVLSYSSMFLAVAPLGLHVHLTNSFFEYPTKYYLVWGRILFLLLLLGALFGCVNSFFIILAFPHMPIVNRLVLGFVGSVSIIFMSNSILAQHLFPIVERPRPLVFTNLIASCLGIIVSFCLIAYFKLGYWGLLSSTVVSTIVSFIVFVKFVWVDYNIKPIIEHKWKRLRDLLRISLPLVPHALGFALLSSSARIIMSIHNVSYEEIGLFSHGCIMGDYAVVITTALTIALAAPMQRYYRCCDFIKFRKLYYLCQGVAIVSSFLICVWMPEIYKLLIHNDNLAKSSGIASLVCFSNVVLPLYSFMSITTFIEKETRQILWLVFVPGILNLLLCLLLIPIWGYMAAVYSTIISYWTQLLIPLFIKYYKTSVRKWLGGLHKLILIMVLFIFALILSNVLNGSSFLVRCIVSISLVSLFVIWYYKNNIYKVV